MNETPDHELKAAEESRRERHWDPLVRWKVLQETMTWAEQQLTVRRNQRESRLEEQRRKLAWLDEYLARKASSS